MSSQETVLDLHLYSPDILMHDATLADALAEVDAILTDTNVEDVIRDMLSKPGLLEFILSASPQVANRVSSHVLDRFPATADAFPSSQAHDLLQRFWSYLFFIRRSFPAEISNSLDACRKSVEMAPPILQAISVMLLSDMDSSIQNGARNRGMRGRRGTVNFDTEPFHQLGMDVPRTAEAARQRAASVIQDQRRILEYYLSIIRRPSLSYIFKAEYISQGPSLSETTPEQPTHDATTDASNDTPRSAYPMVQPMKAALYFDSAVGFGDWRILVSTRATQDLREARRADAKLFKIIVKKIKELSNGHFSDNNQKRLNGPNVSVHIYEAKMTSDQRLVYQVDCIPEYNSDVERQVLRIFGIYTHAQLDRRLWDSLGAQLAGRGREYRRRCNFRKKPHHTGDKVVMPESFPVQGPAHAEPVGSVLDLPREDLDELHSLLVLEKFVAFSQALLNSIIADQDVAHVFSVTPQEKAIVEYNSSCYVLGRSGTGKTTTMLFKMLGIERAWALQSSNESPKPRQLFVTQSRVLAGKVEEYFSKLMDSLATASHSPRELANLTKKRAMWEEEGLVDVDDKIDYRNDLPERFSLLEERHFPLFVTFDKLCKLLEADTVHYRAAGRLLANIAAFDDSEYSTQEQETNPINSSIQDFDPRRSGSYVSYNVFLRAYWPHFSQSLIKGLDPSLVFSEFLGVIKGSEKALTCAERFLDQQSYDSLSYRSQSTFASHRSTVYAIFQLYMKQKRDRGDYDAADRTHSILNNILARGVPGRKIDFLYVDEVQDNLLIDTLLLRSLCKNPDGLFWAGDSAQTISVGSSFRFNDLKAFLFRVEERNSVIGNVSRDPVQPRSFQLAINYRSHGGIVNCAHSVVELITRFWPHAIDNLAQEQGIVDGLKPVFFHGWDSETVRYEQFLFGYSGSQIEFGAQQCILVRDQAAKNKLSAEVGDIGLIMTLYESKGLEFNDVLLYNFFEDSTVDVSQWRVVLNALGSGQRHSNPAPRFNESRHAGVCNELKFLYVAITRARKNVWIVDCSEKGEPMRAVWTSKDQVQNCTPGDDVPRLAVSSTPEEWADFGKSLFKHKRYIQAMHCYERAGMHREVAIADAYSLREQARTIPLGHHEDAPAKAAFLVAAEAFSKCAVAATKEKRAYYRIAGECYVNHGDNDKAAQAYLDAEEYTLTAQLYRKEGRFDDAVRVIQTYRDKMQPNVVESILDVVRLVYFRGFEQDRAADIFLSKVIPLFDTIEKALDFVAEYDLDVAHATLLQMAGRPAEAAEVHFAEGRITEGIEIFLQNLANEDCTRRAVNHVLRALWQHVSFGVSATVAKEDTLLGHWLGLAAQLKNDLLRPRDRDEIFMFQAIMSGNLGRLKQLGLKFYQDHNKPGALLCLDHIFVTPPRIQGATIQETISSLEMFYAYTRLLHDIASLVDPCNNQPVQQLFAFQACRADVFSIFPGAFLYHEVADQQVLFFREKDGKRSLSGRDLSRVLKNALGERLRSRVIEENEICRRAKVFSPCLYALLGICPRAECPRDHPDPAILNPGWYNDRVRIHLQQILIFQNLHFINLPERVKQQIHWLDRLYEALNPYFYAYGCRANLELTLIPGADRGFIVVKDWVRHIIYTNDPYRYSTTFLTTFLRLAILSFDHDSKDAFSYIRRSPCMNRRPPPSLIRKDHGVCIMRDLVTCLHGDQPWCLSAGVMFVRHVVEEKLLINISLLCDFIENLCGSLVVSRRLQQMSTLHDVTLPRSWLLTLLEHSKTSIPKDTELHWILVEPLVTLIGRMHTGSNTDHLLHENRDLSTLFGPIRNVFIYRLCRALSLMGYNFRNDELREKIGQGITSLNKRDRPLPPLYRRYFEAKHWGGFVSAVRLSTDGSPMDEMIQLYHEGRVQGPLFPIRGVRRIFFKAMEQIPSLLGATAQIIPASKLDDQNVVILPPTTTRRQAVIVNENSDVDTLSGMIAEDTLNTDSHATSDADEHDPEENVGQETGGDEKIAEEAAAPDIEELELDPTVDAETLARSMNTERAQDVVDAPSQQQVDAACIIQAMYRRNLRRRRRGRGARNTLAEARSQFFAQCWVESEKMEWSHGRYRLLFLGPLPHLLLCLERANTFAFESKMKVKRRLNSAKHLDLEDVQMKMTEANRVFKELLRLQRTLEPKAIVHKNRDLQTLKALVQEAETLIHGLGCAHELQDDLGLAVKGIVTINSQKKPKLCMDDDEMYDYME